MTEYASSGLGDSPWLSYYALYPIRTPYKYFYFVDYELSIEAPSVNTNPVDILPKDGSWHDPLSDEDKLLLIMFNLAHYDGPIFKIEGCMLEYMLKCLFLYEKDCWQDIEWPKSWIFIYLNHEGMLDLGVLDPNFDPKVMDSSFDQRRSMSWRVIMEPLWEYAIYIGIEKKSVRPAYISRTLPNLIPKLFDLGEAIDKCGIRTSVLSRATGIVADIVESFYQIGFYDLSNRYLGCKCDEDLCWLSKDDQNPCDQCILYIKHLKLKSLFISCSSLWEMVMGVVDTARELREMTKSEAVNTVLYLANDLKNELAGNGFLSEIDITADGSREKPSLDKVVGKLVNIVSSGLPYTNVRDLADRLTCSTGLVSKAINSSKILTTWRGATKKPRIPQAKSLNDFALSSIPQSTEPDPAQHLPEEEIDMILMELCNQAGPRDRKRVSQMSSHERRKLAMLYQAQRKDIELSPLDDEGSKIKRYKKV